MVGKKHVLLGLVVFLMLVPFISNAQERNAALLASSCAACHGTNGHSEGGLPSLAGLSESYIMLQMQEFASGKRKSTVMFQHVSGYSQEEIELMAAFFAKQ